MQAAFSPTRRFTRRDARAFWRSAASARLKPERTCPVELAARSHVVCFNAFRDGIGGDTEWHDLDFDRVAELFDKRGLDDLLEAKRDEAELSEDLGLVRESDCL